MNQELIEIFNEMGNPLLSDNVDELCEEINSEGLICENVSCIGCLIYTREENSWCKTIEIIHKQTKQEESQ